MNNIVSGLYAVYIAYDFLYDTNNALTAEISWSCFLVMFSRRKSHVACKAVFSHDRKNVAQLKSIYMFGLLFIILTLTL